MRSEDWIGQRKGRLTIEAFEGLKSFGRGKAAYFRFRCDCGKAFVSQKSNVWNSRRTDCGCGKTDRAPMRPSGASNHPLYKTWAHMIDRCDNPSNKSYRDYGGRGISVCERWRTGDGLMTGFEAFVQDMGDKPEPSLTIERNDGSAGYGPSNCRWADRLTQGRNRRGLRLVTVDGLTLPASVWAERSGVPYFTFVQRLNRGVDPKLALSTTDLRSVRFRK
jgi:hypothetical protein